MGPLIPMGQTPTFVVIGAGQAGGRAVEAMRAAGFSGRILLVGHEAYVPYERPPLSKKMLTGDGGPDSAYLHDPSFYDDRKIEMRLGVDAVAIDREARSLQLSNGETLVYDKLLLTTGARVRRIAIPGAELPGVDYLRDMDESLSLRARLGAGARLVVIGGGYIGLEAASAARARGCHVVVLEAADRVLNRVVAPEISRFYEDLHRANGVDIRTGVKLLEFTGDGKVEAVVCEGGVTCPADFVIVGIGVEAETGLAEAAGLTVDNGIVVDAFGRTSDKNIYAAGDVANQPNEALGRRVRLESWQNAQNQAIAVARVMCGGSEPYQELPWFWSDQYGLNLQMVGLPEGWDRLVIRGDLASHKFTAFYLCGGLVVGANALNNPRDIRFTRMLMEQGARPDPAALADPNVPLKSLLGG
jgi:3-phenylpropionate/trans-cinnamate dioxygenase ferredoxin reductase subunit